MSGTSINRSLPMDVEQQIDHWCDRFEDAWRAGTVPDLNEYLRSAPKKLEPFLLRELLAIELHYRRNKQGHVEPDDVVLDSHTDLMPQIAEALREIRTAEAKFPIGRAKNEQGLTEPAGNLPSDKRAEGSEVLSEVARYGPTPGCKESRGLHIRCPHCNSPVEVLADSPFTDVTCGSCGSQFSLVEREGQAFQAVALEQLGRFELIARLGVGGFGSVWKARDTDLERIVAVKIPRKGQLNVRELEQFFREARAAAQLRHPHIVSVHEVGREAETVFIVSDYIRGLALSDWLARVKPSARETAELVATVADALHCAHEQGIVHRDLKPSNIMIDDAQRPYVMDFGLAKREFGEITMTVDGQILGTPAHMSPEQASGNSHLTDRRADIYSLGVILFQMLTGELPFRGNAQMQIHQKLHADAPEPRKLNRHIPADMATICLKCLENDPHKRYATSLELADELHRFLRGEPIRARPISPLARATRWSRRNPALAAVVALTTFLSVAGPISALVIYLQSKTVEQQQNERLNQISQQMRERKTHDARVAELDDQVNVLLRRRPDRVEFAAWKENLVYQLLEQQYEKVTAVIESETLEADKQVRAHLGLAMLLRSVGHDEDAIEHFANAKELLSTLSRSHPDEERFRSALADCCTSLGALYADRNPNQSAAEYQQALLIRKELLHPHDNPLRSEAAYLDALLDAPVDGTDPEKWLRQMQRIREHLQQLLASDPVAGYELCRELNIPGPRLRDSELSNDARDGRTF